jgi:hypothetical protein
VNQDRAEEGRHRARPITEPPGQGEERERLGHQDRVEIAADQPVIGERGARDEDAKDRGEVSGGAGAVKRPPEPVSGDREQHDLDEPEEQDRVGNADDQGQRGESAQIPVRTPSPPASRNQSWARNVGSSTRPSSTRCTS